MKLTDKITHEIVVELLSGLGLESDGGSNFSCHDSEQSVDVIIKGNTIEDLLQFIKKYYYDMGFKYGGNCGRREKIEEIRKVLEIN